MSWFVGRSSSSLKNGYLVTQGNNRRSNKSPTLRIAESRSLASTMPRSGTISHKRTDSVVEPNFSVQVSDDSISGCDLSKERDVFDLIDAVVKLLRYTELCTDDQRSIVADLRCALGRIMPGEIITSDKSLVISAILEQADNLRLDCDASSILPIVRKLIAVVEL